MDTERAYEATVTALKDAIDTLSLDEIRDAIRTELTDEIRDEVMDEIRAELRSAIEGTELDTAPQEGTTEAWGKEDHAGLTAFLAYMEDNL